MHGRFYRPRTKDLWGGVKLDFLIFFLSPQNKKSGKVKNFQVSVPLDFFLVIEKLQHKILFLSKYFYQYLE